jgi:DNA-binding transcriptional LysR family regulator
MHSASSSATRIAAPLGRSSLLEIALEQLFGRRWASRAAINFLAQYPLLELDLHLSDEVVDLRARRVDVDSNGIVAGQ